MLLLLLAATMAGATAAMVDKRADAVFLVDTAALANAARYQVLYYTGANRHARVMPIATNQTGMAMAAAGLSPLLVKSRGRLFLWPQEGVVDLRIAPAGSSAIWMRWRYASLTNHTLTLSSIAPEAASSASASRFVCQRAGAGAGAVWCDAGLYRYGNSSYAVQIDPERPRGLLPARLLFLLSEQRVRSLAATPSIAAASLTAQLAADTVCVTLAGAAPSGGTFTLCDDDSVYFDMAADASTIVLGGAYWRRNHSRVIVDGWTGTITAQYAPPDPDAVLAWQWAGVAFYWAAFILYGLWLWSEQRMSASLYLHTIATGANSWHLHWRIQLATVLLVPLGATAAVIGWLGGTAAGQLGAAPPVIDTIDFTFMAAALTVYLGMQLALAAITFAGWEAGSAEAGLPDGTCHACCMGMMVESEFQPRDLRDRTTKARRRVFQWCSSHRVNMRVAWVRHMTTVTAIQATAALATLPLAYAGGVAGNELMLFFLLPPLLLLTWHHIYYATFLLAASFVEPSGAGILTGILELALMGALGAAALTTYLRPLFAAAAVLFGEAAMNAAAVTLGMFVVAGALLFLLFETAHTLRIIAKEL